MRAITLCVLAILACSQAQAQTAGGPKFLYGHDIKVRAAGKTDFDKDTPKVGIEFYHDAASGTVFAISEAGNIAAIPFIGVGKEHRISWAFANEYRARPGEEESFAKAKKYSSEGLKDAGTGKILYVTDHRTIALADTPQKLESGKEPAWHHALVLKVRDPKDTSFDKAKKFGVEAFKDQNTGGLIYISETGSLTTAVAPAAAPPAGAVKAPRALHGLNLRVRKANEPGFENAKTYGVEVFEDRNTNALIYISETGSIAAVPMPTGGVQSKQKPVWVHAFSVSARKAGEEFTKAARYGVEVFQDNHTGYTVYISETGAIAVVPKSSS